MNDTSSSQDSYKYKSRSFAPASKSDPTSDISEIVDAEKKAERIILDAKKKADAIVLTWNEEVRKERMKTEAEIRDYKNKKIAEGKKKIDQKVSDLINKKKREADAIRGLKMNAKFLESIAVRLLKSV